MENHNCSVKTIGFVGNAEIMKNMTQMNNADKIVVDDKPEVIITKKTSVSFLLHLIAEKGLDNDELTIKYVCSNRPTEIANTLLNYLKYSYGWYVFEKERKNLKKPEYTSTVWVVKIKKHGAIKVL